MTRVTTLLLVCSLAVVSLGCNAGRVFIASSGDYADYRAVRVAEDVDERLARAWAYLEERPDGQYAPRLRRFFERAEPVFFRVRRRSIKGLEAYLRALPNGPHAKEALALLGDMRDDKRRDSLDSRQALITGLALDARRERRERAADLLHWWVSSLLERKVWDEPLSEAPGELIVRYQLSLPQPRCAPSIDDPTHQRCVKAFETNFRVPGADGVADRTLAFLLEVELDETWRLVRVTISGAGALIASEEARRKKAAEDDDRATLQRATAAFVARLTAKLFDRDVACNGGTDATGRTRLVWRGVESGCAPRRRWKRRRDRHRS